MVVIPKIAATFSFLIFPTRGSSKQLMRYLPVFIAITFLSPLTPAFSQLGFGFEKENIVVKKPETGIEGQPAPPLIIDTWIQLPEGKKTINLNDYKGKVVIIKCFQSWCSACQTVGLPTLKKLVDKYEGDDRVQFLAVQATFEGYLTNTDEQLAPTAKKFGLKIPFGHSPKLKNFHSISIDYKTGGTPWWIVINQDGVVEYNGHDMDVKSAVENLEELFAKKTRTSSTE